MSITSTAPAEMPVSSKSAEGQIPGIISASEETPVSSELAEQPPTVTLVSDETPISSKSLLD